MALDFMTFFTAVLFGSAMVRKQQEAGGMRNRKVGLSQNLSNLCRLTRVTLKQTKHMYLGTSQARS